MGTSTETIRNISLVRKVRLEDGGRLGGVCARRPACDQRATGGAPKTARRIREAGAAGPPATGRQRGGVLSITAAVWNAGSTGGVLVTKNERKMLASTCLYSLYAWFTGVVLNGVT